MTGNIVELNGSFSAYRLTENMKRSLSGRINIIVKYLILFQKTYENN